LRYFNSAGADPAAEIGECHEPETHLVPLTIAAAQRRAPALTVFGTDHATPDGTAVRDYVHVCDLASAHVAALAYLQRGGAATEINLGTGSGHSVRQVRRAVERVSGRSVPLVAGPRRPGDPPVMVAASDKAGALLGWRPAFTDLEEIVETAWRWHATA
jgi:UDP-glucose 4-epimerase